MNRPNLTRPSLFLHGASTMIVREIKRGEIVLEADPFGRLMRDGSVEFEWFRVLRAENTPNGVVVDLESVKDGKRRLNQRFTDYEAFMTAEEYLAHKIMGPKT